MKPSNSRQAGSGGGLVAGLQPTEAVALCLILVGAALRVRTFLSGRGLWLDESMIALNIMHRSFLDLMGALDYQQYAPIGWLWSVKAAALLFGDGERGLRAVALLSGLSVLPLTWIVARRFLPEAGALLALALVALNWELIYYSAEVKPYGSDVLASLLALLLLSGPILDPDQSAATRSRLLRALVGAIVLQLFSFPVIFMLAGLGLSLFLRILARADRRAALMWCGVGAGWVAAFALLYAVFYQRGTSSDFLQAWRGAFVPLPGSETESRWYARTLELLASSVTGITPLPVAYGVMLAGVAWFGRRHPWRLLALASALPFLWLASFIRAYPMVNRLVLFTAPVLSLIAAGALGWFVRDWKQRSERMAWALVTGGILWNSFSLDINKPWRGAAYGDPKPILTDLARYARPGDLVVLAANAFPPFEYYAPRLGLEGYEPVMVVGLAEDPRDLAALRRAGAGHERVWIVVGQLHPDPVRARDALDKLADRLKGAGTLTGRDARYRAALLLFDMRGPAG